MEPVYTTYAYGSLHAQIDQYWARVKAMKNIKLIDKVHTPEVGKFKIGIRILLP